MFFKVPGRLGLLITLYLIASNVYNSVEGPPSRGFSYIEIWMIGVHIPMLVAIFEYGLILAMKDQWEISTLKRMDKITFCSSATFIALFNLFYWIWAALL